MKDSEVRLHRGGGESFFILTVLAEVIPTQQVACSHVKLNQGELHTMTIKHLPVLWLFHLKPPG